VAGVSVPPGLLPAVSVCTSTEAVVPTRSLMSSGTSSRYTRTGTRSARRIHWKVGLIDHTRRGYRPKNALLMPDKSGVWKPQPVTSQVQAEPGLMIYCFTHSMYYANSRQLDDA